ncbi:hypothetical protein B0J14DRAFT_357184 [Halenospora varia]|nr:hypothetical protein B0J14DRAFT_357184 [Halenospora varia]
MAPTPSQSITEPWVKYVKARSRDHTSSSLSYCEQNPQTLITSSQPDSFYLGTGAQVLSKVLSKCLRAQKELIIVTCFWANSQSQDDVASLLLKLSSRAIAQNRKIQVRLCFSSRSIAQKLFQTSSLDGKIYPSSSWASLGLPAPEKLEGLELVVKSVFVRPFSVMHPKFILVDRQLAFMPSCNVSWEKWFEGCVEMRGEICEKLFDFWQVFWSRGGASLPSPLIESTSTEVSDALTSTPVMLPLKDITLSPELTPTILLPSSHHINPDFHPFMSPKSHIPPTPLNVFLLQLLDGAKLNIYIQTPNLTSGPAISAILDALQRGVHVHLVTSSRLMIVEQLVTAGTITEFEVWKLRRRYQKLVNLHNCSSISDPESQRPRPGTLHIGYYRPRQISKDFPDEPVKSHLKLTIVDEEVVVLGSGNMDRASWYTSQELGVAFFSRGVARDIKTCVEEGLEGRVAYVC